MLPCSSEQGEEHPLPTKHPRTVSQPVLASFWPKARAGECPRGLISSWKQHMCSLFPSSPPRSCGRGGSAGVSAVPIDQHPAVLLQHLLRCPRRRSAAPHKSITGAVLIQAGPGTKWNALKQSGSRSSHRSILLRGVRAGTRASPCAGAGGTTSAGGRPERWLRSN